MNALYRTKLRENRKIILTIYNLQCLGCKTKFNRDMISGDDHATLAEIGRLPLVMNYQKVGITSKWYIECCRHV